MQTFSIFNSMQHETRKSIHIPIVIVLVLPIR